MKRSEFKSLCMTRPVMLDGATGTELIKRGLPTGVCPELWVLENPHALLEVQKAYRAAGCDIVYTCTFGANRCKLEEFGIGDRVVEMNRELAALSKQAAGADGFAFGSLAPTGRLVEPFGDFAFEECVAVFREQAQALLDGGVDGFVIETMMDIQEARAALIAVREVTLALPIMVTMTYGAEGTTLTGTDPQTALITLQSLGADAVGCNCSAGPAKMIEWIKVMKPFSTVPLAAKPNAGQPRLIDGKTVFDMGPDAYANFFPALIAAGANLLGGCCGSSPKHLAAACKMLHGLTPQEPALGAISAVSSARMVTRIGGGNPFTVIGERINPTGKKSLQAELREGRLSLVREYALEQSRAGAGLLDVNMGLSGIDEKQMLLEAVRLLAPLVATPLCLDSTKPEAMEAALRLYPGRALINSVSAEKERLELMLPLAKKYGAMYILLPVTDDKVPEELEERKAVTRLVLAEGEKLGLTIADAVIDGIVMTVSSSPQAPSVTLDFVEWCARELGANTTGGISNVSFGMPERAWLNASFLNLLIGRGLTTAIMNPSVEMMTGLKFASDALLGRDPKFSAFLSRFGNAKKEVIAAKETKPLPQRAFDCVLYGEDDNIATVLLEAIRAGVEAKTLVDDALIPAIVRVGELYDKKEYFLPQLMMSAQAMSLGFEALEPYLAKDSRQKSGKIIMATVKGDIHDIGKNIVCLMLRNYGFEVIDLGKDVPAQSILDAAAEHDTNLIGLSALMTTTMSEMKKVIELAHQCGRGNLRFMVGGAVVDKAYAEEIGAHGYAADAVEAVRVAQKLCAVQ